MSALYITNKSVTDSTAFNWKIVKSKKRDHNSAKEEFGWVVRGVGAGAELSISSIKDLFSKAQMLLLDAHTPIQLGPHNIFFANKNLPLPSRVPPRESELTYATHVIREQSPHATSLP